MCDIPISEEPPYSLMISYLPVRIKEYLELRDGPWTVLELTHIACI